jgi:hypothetical protein
MGAASHFAALWLTNAVPSQEWYWRAVRVSGAIGAGVVVLMGSARALAIAEFNDALSQITRRFVRR